MKKLTLFIGLFSSLLFLMGVLFKIMHWPFAGIMFFVSVLLFAFGYAPLLFVDKNKLADNAYQKFMNVAALIVMIVISGGFLFKVMHWPGAGILVAAGNFLLVLLIPAIIVHASREKDTKRRLGFYNLGIILILLTSFSFFIWLGI